MPSGKGIFIASVCLFGAIGAIGLWKKGEKAPSAAPLLVQEVPLLARPPAESPSLALGEKTPSLPPKEDLKILAGSSPQEEALEAFLPEADRIAQLFALDSSKLPFVETVSYTSRVPWLKERPAWISDYAGHFSTSRHFIARSLNRHPDYFTQKVAPGDRFNVFKRDVDLAFHLVIDLSRCKLWLYAVDQGANLKYLLKSYRVGLGRLDPKRASGSLTPLGTYSLGERVAIYKPGTKSYFQGKEEEMIRIFGTRWIPFEKEIEGCTEAAKGFGLHGAPWVEGEKGLVEEAGKIGRYDSDGCVRLAAADMEELFAIIITKPSFVHLVRSFSDAHIPGVEPKEFSTPLVPR